MEEEGFKKHSEGEEDEDEEEDEEEQAGLARPEEWRGPSVAHSRPQGTGRKIRALIPPRSTSVYVLKVLHPPLHPPLTIPSSSIVPTSRSLLEAWFRLCPEQDRLDCPLACFPYCAFPCGSRPLQKARLCIQRLSPEIIDSGRTSITPQYLSTHLRSACHLPGHLPSATLRIPIESPLPQIGASTRHPPRPRITTRSRPQSLTATTFTTGSRLVIPQH